MTERTAYVLLVLSVLFWSGNWIVGKALAPLVPPAGLTFSRWALALPLLSPLGWGVGRGGSPPRPQPPGGRAAGGGDPLGDPRALAADRAARPARWRPA